MNFLVNMVTFLDRNLGKYVPRHQEFQNVEFCIEGLITKRQIIPFYLESIGAGELAWWLRALAALQKTLDQYPAPIWWLISVTGAPGDQTLYWLLQALQVSSVQT